MSLDQIKSLVPDYAKDLRLNLSSVLEQSVLSKEQTWGSALAASISSRQPKLLKEVRALAEQELSPEVLEASFSAAAIMGMNNIFYRFRELSQSDKYSQMPAQLRMNAIRSHNASKTDFELWSLVASTVNGCGVCVSAHEKALLENGVSEDQILAAVRIGSVLHAIATVIDAELSQS